MYPKLLGPSVSSFISVCPSWAGFPEKHILRPGSQCKRFIWKATPRNNGGGWDSEAGREGGQSSYCRGTWSFILLGNCGQWGTGLRVTYPSGEGARVFIHQVPLVIGRGQRGMGAKVKGTVP